MTELKIKVAVFVFPTGEWETVAWADEDAAAGELPDPDLWPLRHAEGAQLRVTEATVQPWSEDNPIPLIDREASGPGFFCWRNWGCEVVFTQKKLRTSATPKPPRKPREGVPPAKVARLAAVARDLGYELINVDGTGESNLIKLRIQEVPTKEDGPNESA